VGRQRVLDLGWIHVLSSGDDHVFLAPDDEEMPVGIVRSEIAGAIPAVGHRRLRCLWAAPVPRHDVRAGDVDLPDLFAADRNVLVVAQAQPHARRRLAHRPQPPALALRAVVTIVAGQLMRDDARGLSDTIRLHQVDTQRRRGARMHRFGHR